MGVVVSTYTHHENGTRPFGRDDARRYAREFDVSSAHLLALAEGGEPSARPPAQLTAVDAVLDVWRPAAGYVPHRTKKMSLPRDLALKPGGYLVHVQDRSVDKAVPKGDYAVCEAIRPGLLDMNQFHVGDLVHVERICRGFKEITIRRVHEKDSASLCLSVYSSDPEISSKIDYTAKSRRGEQVTLIGIVVGVYRRLKVA
jgi:hypothetical protein